MTGSDPKRACEACAQEPRGNLRQIELTLNLLNTRNEEGTCMVRSTIAVCIVSGSPLTISTKGREVCHADRHAITCFCCTVHKCPVEG